MSEHEIPMEMQSCIELLNIQGIGKKIEGRTD